MHVCVHVCMHVCVCAYVQAWRCVRARTCFGKGIVVQAGVRALASLRAELVTQVICRQVNISTAGRSCMFLWAVRDGAMFGLPVAEALEYTADGALNVIGCATLPMSHRSLNVSKPLFQRSLIRAFCRAGSTRSCLQGPGGGQGVGDARRRAATAGTYANVLALASVWMTPVC